MGSCDCVCVCVVVVAKKKPELKPDTCWPKCQCPSGVPLGFRSFCSSSTGPVGGVWCLSSCGKRTGENMEGLLKEIQQARAETVGSHGTSVMNKPQN